MSQNRIRKLLYRSNMVKNDAYLLKNNKGDILRKNARGFYSKMFYNKYEDTYNHKIGKTENLDDRIKSLDCMFKSSHHNSIIRNNIIIAPIIPLYFVETKDGSNLEKLIKKELKKTNSFTYASYIKGGSICKSTETIDTSNKTMNTITKILYNKKLLVKNDIKIEDIYIASFYVKNNCLHFYNKPEFNYNISQLKLNDSDNNPPYHSKKRKRSVDDDEEEILKYML